MKLRTRIALLSGAMIFLATLLCSAAFWRLYSAAELRRAVAEGAVAAKNVWADYEAYRTRFQGRLSREQLLYFFKTRGSDFCIAAVGNSALYNQTALPLSEVAAAPYSVEWEQSMSYAALTENGRQLVIFRLGDSGLDLYYVEDVTQVHRELNTLLCTAALVSLAAAGATALTLVLVLRRALRPLAALSEGARAIAAGAYDRRVAADRGDEIGGLGRDFNRMADAVEHHIREVEESEEKKTMFMGSLTHELKTPLTAISGYAQTLRAVKLSPADEEAALRYIHEESGRLDRLSKKMMRLLELDRDTGIPFETLSTAELFAAARRTASVFAAQRGVSVEIGPAEGTVRGDRDLLTDAFVNLIDNAVKASEPGGAVRVYTENGAMVVEDAGCGIPPEEIGRITEPFYMVDKSRSRKNGGAGLGLALTAMILRRHGLALSIESRPGEGTKVSVSAAADAPGAKRA